MPKITMIEAAVDPLLKNAGKAMVLRDEPTEETKIAISKLSNVKVSILSSEMKSAGDSFVERVRLKIDPVTHKSPAAFRKFIKSFIQNGAEYTNHYVKLNKTRRMSESLKDPSTVDLATYEITTKFNYASEHYDVLQKTIPEVSLPSIVSGFKKDSFLTFKKDRKKTPLVLGPSSVEFKNFVIPNCGKNVKRNLNASELSDQFPFYNKITVSNKISTNFTNFINKIGSFDEILTTYIKSPKRTIKLNIQSGQSTQTKELPVFDLNAWIDSADQKKPTDYRPLEKGFYEDSPMINSYKKLLLAGYIRKISSGNFRKFEEIFNSQVSYQEDFVYSIDKFSEAKAGSPGQIFYLPAVNDILSFNDTQIKYGKKYIYCGYGHYIIVGNTYTYSNLTFEEVEENTECAYVTVTNSPSIVIVPVKLFEKPVKNLMPPPIFPQVNFVTENDSNNQIQIYLSPTKGDRADPLIKITPEDENRLEELRDSSLYEDDKIKFKFIQQSGLYQIFRVSEPPEDYTSFREKKLSEVRMGYLTNSARFDDHVTPNKKYYYLFRKENAKGLVSNPTPIYEVELVKDADESKILVKKYEFPVKPTSQGTRKFKSLFQIYPAQDQTWFDSDQPYLLGKTSLKQTVDNLSLGMADQSIWGRKFKFRIKSTTTGKIIDYNVTFKLTKNKTEEDF